MPIECPNLCSVVFSFVLHLFSSQRSALLPGWTGRAGQHAAGSAGGAGERNQSEAPEGRTDGELRPTMTGRWTEPATSEEGGFYVTLTLCYPGRSVIRPVGMRLWTLDLNIFSKSLQVPSRNYFFHFSLKSYWKFFLLRPIFTEPICKVTERTFNLLKTRFGRYGFFSADTMTGYYLTLVADNDKRNQHFYVF